MNHVTVGLKNNWEGEWNIIGRLMYHFRNPNKRVVSDRKYFLINDFTHYYNIMVLELVTAGLSNSGYQE